MTKRDPVYLQPGP